MGSAAIVFAVLLVAAGPWLDGDQASRVHVRWRPGLSAAAQQALEARYGLRLGVGADRSYGYDLVNPSRGNIRALLSDPAVEDTQDLDRARFAVAEGAGRGDLHTGWAWQWGLEEWLPATNRVATALVVGGMLLLLWPSRWPGLPRVTLRSSRAAGGVAAVVAGLAGLAAVPWLNGAPTRTIVVSWTEGIDQDERLALQGRHGLTEQTNRGVAFTYDLSDDSPANLRALIQYPAVEGTDYINRDTFTVDGRSPEGTRRTGLAWRWRVEHWLPWVNLASALLLVGGLILRFGGRLRRLLDVVWRVSGVRGGTALRRRVRSVIVARRQAIAVGGVFLLALAMRWLSMTGLGGDDHWSLWTAATFLKGDRPFQEFVDPGDPLYWGMSALVQLVVGYRAIGEIALGLLLIAFAIAISFRLSWLASGSARIAFVLALVTIALVMPTKLYSYPKIFLYPLNLWLGWRYIDRPSLSRAIQLAAAVAIAFGYRHDHGAYAAVGASAAVVAAHLRDGVGRTAGALVRVGAMTVALLSPYFLLAQMHEGLVPYFRERMNFSAQTDAAGRRSVPFVQDRTQPWLVAVNPPAPVPVSVRWRDAVSSERRASLEQLYGLTPVQVAARGWHRYIVTDYSLPNLTALLAERKLVTVEGIVGSFRQGFALDDEARPVITVRWRDAAAPEIAAREGKYRLSRTDAGPGVSGIAYRLGDPSVENVTALHQDQLAEAVEGVHFVRVPVEARLRERVPEGPPVSIRWREGLSAAQRVVLEQQFRLLAGERDPRDPRQVMWLYELGDPTPETVTALATDPAVVEFDQIERGLTPGTYMAEPWTPARGGRLSVVWGPVTDAERRLLEERYHLDPSVDSDGFTAYTLADGQAAALATLAAAPEIAALRGVDASGRVAGDGWLGALRRRLAPLRVVPFPRLFLKENAGVWLYYVAFLLPFLTLAVLLIDRLRGTAGSGMPNGAAKMFAAAVLMGVANLGLLRKLGYFPDHFDVTVIMAAWLLGRGLHGAGRSAIRVAIATGVVLVAATSLVSAAAYVDLPTMASRYRLNEPLADQVATNVARFRAYSTSPPIDMYAPAGADADRGVVRYLYECTRPDDRIFVTSDVYTVPYYTERRVVGHIFWANGLLATPQFEDRMIALMERDPVPVVFGVGGQRPLDNLRKYPRVQAYVARRYTGQHAVLQDQLAGTVLWLLTDSRRTPTGTYERLGLPCFR